MKEESVTNSGSKWLKAFLDREESLDMQALSKELKEGGDEELVRRFRRLREIKDLSPDEQKIWNYIQSRIRSKPKHRVRRLLKYVAIVAIPLCAGSAWWLLQQEQQEESSVTVLSTSIPPGQQRAYLLLSNRESLDLTCERKDTLLEEQGVQVRIDSLGRISYRGEQRKSGSKDLVYNTMVVPRAGEFFLELPDGTKVWLNSFSELKFPIDFLGDERKVFLKGEAYFEVSKDANKPFYVVLNEMSVKVLGTSFNVNAYRDHGKVLTTLVTGKVEIQGMLGESLVVLSPGEQADFSGGGVKVEQVNVENYIAWREGKFYFEAMRLEDIMLQLQRWYDVEVVFASTSLKEKTFTGVIRRDLAAEEIFSIIEKTTQVKFEREGRQVVVCYK